MFVLIAGGAPHGRPRLLIKLSGGRSEDDEEEEEEGLDFFLKCCSWGFKGDYARDHSTDGEQKKDRIGMNNPLEYLRVRV